jgi:hypothetical protein
LSIFTASTGEPCAVFGVEGARLFGGDVPSPPWHPDTVRTSAAISIAIVPATDLFFVLEGMVDALSSHPSSIIALPDDGHLPRGPERGGKPLFCGTGR